jgi:hypothetical protein
VKLPLTESNQIINLNKQLLLYANKRLKVINNLQTLNDLMNIEVEKWIKIRDALHEKPEIIDDFVTRNPYRLIKKQLDLVLEWKNSVKGTFYIVKHLKNYSIFLEAKEAPHAYGVLGLSEEFKDMLGPELPKQVKTVLIPYKGMIVFDGLIVMSRIIFGKGYRTDLNEQYREAKFRYGVITSLPWSGDKKTSKEDQLSFYMKSSRSLEHYWYEIEDLLQEDPTLEKVYHLRLGKLYSRKLKKQLKNIGVKDAWFAVIDNLIVTSGPSKKHVTETLKKIIPNNRVSHAYVFHLKIKN